MNEQRINHNLRKLAESMYSEQHLTAAGCRSALVILRMKSRCVIERLIEACNEIRRLEREERKLKNSGIIALPLVVALESARTKRQVAQVDLSLCGSQIVDFLDRWQEKGATLLDLCFLCGHEHRRTLKEIEAKDRNERFSRLIFVCNLDFRNDTADFLDYGTDAPLTHAVKDYMLDLMTNTERGQAAAHEALTVCFPGLFN